MTKSPTQERLDQYPDETFRAVALTELTEQRTLLTNSFLSHEFGLSPMKIEGLLLGTDKIYETPQVSVYAGHQFGKKVHQLGDGRAHLIGEITSPNGDHLELQLKGSGKTPFSGPRDGLASLSTCTSEYFASEHLFALGIPTTRSLAISNSNQLVIGEVTETASRLLRSAPSFLRFGHFEWPLNNESPKENEELFSFVLENFYPQYKSQERKVALVYSEICKSTANLIANWMALGFCHGLMNTDNMSIHGVTIDYGSFGFIESFDLNSISNENDQEGRYSFQNQPPIAHWNLKVLANCWQTLEGAKGLNLEKLSNQFVDQFNFFHRSLMLKKLGLAASPIPARGEEQLKLIQTSIKMLHDEKLDYTFFWRKLGQYDGQRNKLLDVLEKSESLIIDEFLDKYDFHLRQQDCNDERCEQMNKVNPYLVLKNHLVKDLIDAAKQEDIDFLNDAFEVLRRPYQTNRNWESYTRPNPLAK
jgi:uncharacterized protein YdiU (UPF0061 family)